MNKSAKEKKVKRIVYKGFVCRANHKLWLTDHYGHSVANVPVLYRTKPSFKPSFGDKRATIVIEIEQ